MEQIEYTIQPEERLSLMEWMQEFNIGRRAPKFDGGGARQIMSMWPPLEKSFFDKVLADSSIDGIFRS
jgi:hypothetical protein